MAKYYAIVNSNPEGKPRYWVIMLNAFAGIADYKTDKNVLGIYDLKGSNRKGKSGGESKEQDFDADFQHLGVSFMHGYFPLETGAENVHGGYTDFIKNLVADVAVLRQEHVHDYSLVLRITETAPSCPVQFEAVEGGWEAAVAEYAAAPSWQGTGSEFCGLAHETVPVRITAVLLDYLQDGTTLHNQMASALHVFQICCLLCATGIFVTSASPGTDACDTNADGSCAASADQVAAGEEREVSAARVELLQSQVKHTRTGLAQNAKDGVAASKSGTDTKPTQQAEEAELTVSGAAQAPPPTPTPIGGGGNVFQCVRWCASNPSPWSVKCGPGAKRAFWNGGKCAACPECDPPPSPAPTPAPTPLITSLR